MFDNFKMSQMCLGFGIARDGNVKNGEVGIASEKFTNGTDMDTDTAIETEIIPYVRK